MAYTPTYTGDDLGTITIDVLGTILVIFVSLASVVGLVLVYRWFQGKPLLKGMKGFKMS